MARKTRAEVGGLSPPDTSDHIEVIAHRVVKDHFQKYINTVNLVLSVAAAMVTAIGLGTYFWLIQQMVEGEVAKVRTELAIPKSTIIGMTTINRDNSGTPKCPPGWVYLRSAEGRFVVGAVPEYAAGQQPLETLILSSSEEILTVSSETLPPSGYRNLDTNETPHLTASIGKTNTKALWPNSGKNAQNAQPGSDADNVVPFVAAFFCIKE